MKGNLALSLESVEVRMGQLAKDEITFRRSFGFGEIVDSINRVTRDDFIRICERIFGKRKLSVVSVGRLSGQKIEESCVKL
jgi:predicted Zn-dependent peptidase